MLKKKNEGSKKKTLQNSSGDSYQPPQVSNNASNRQPKVQHPQPADEKMRGDKTESEIPDQIYQSVAVNVVLDELKLDEDQRDDIMVSWENARLTGTLDEYVNSDPFIGLKAICDKLLKADGMLVDEEIAEAKDGDFVP